MTTKNKELPYHIQTKIDDMLEADQDNYGESHYCNFIIGHADNDIHKMLSPKQVKDILTIMLHGENI